MMRTLPQLASVVQRNCDISDARHAGDYGMCTFLLKMREYYRWENELPFARSPPRGEVGGVVGGRAGPTTRLSSCEYARELAAPPAMLQGRTIFVRLESVRRYLWEKIEEWQGRQQDNAMA